MARLVVDLDDDIRLRPRAQVRSDAVMLRRAPVVVTLRSGALPAGAAPHGQRRPLRCSGPEAAATASAVGGALLTLGGAGLGASSCQAISDTLRVHGRPINVAVPQPGRLRDLALPGLILGDLHLQAVGDRFTAQVAILGGALAVPGNGDRAPVAALQPMPSGGAGLLLGTPEGATTAVLRAAGGRLVLTPTGAMIGLVQLVVFDDPERRVDALSAEVDRTGRLVVHLTGRVSGEVQLLGRTISSTR